ncbi:MAG: plasmid stabilization protein ParE [Desulfuromonas sp.]|nr:MAG: plasmid stabilization protein ParE [Desulfuromonas sp.]
MPSFALTRLAVTDLKEIARYTERRWGREQRNHYLIMLDNTFRQLATHPLHGKGCNEIRSGYRKFAAGSHLIFYRLRDKEAIEIVRVLHKRMDPDIQLDGL